MKPAEAEKLLGGYATGTLTDQECQRLFTSALDHQEIFDALVDEEALRDLLADPAVKAQLILALAHSAPPNVVPFWRRKSLLGAVASLLVATTAGLVYLRSPDKMPSPLSQEAPKVVAPVEAPPVPAKKHDAEPATGGTLPLRPPPAQGAAAPVPPPPPPAQVAAAAAPPAASEDAALRKAQADEARDQVAKKAEAPRPAAAAVVEVLPNVREASTERKKVAQEPPVPIAPGTVSGGAVGALSRSTPAPTRAKAKAEDRLAAAKNLAAPTWHLTPRTDGATIIEVTAPRGAHLVLLQRGPSGTTALTLQPRLSAEGDTIPWHCVVRLGVEDRLDLYRLDRPVADPKRLPEAGPVNGTRVRIHPPAN